MGTATRRRTERVHDRATGVTLPVDAGLHVKLPRFQFDHVVGGLGQPIKVARRFFRGQEHEQPITLLVSHLSRQLQSVVGDDLLPEELHDNDRAIR